jgi:hypothetical protein
MNPIPTTNSMKPAAGKGVPSFPTPVIKDTVIVEVVNAWKGDYVPLEYGAKWDDHPHASQQGSFPDHKLISQAPTSEEGQWVKRIWANDRVDQDTYNYAIKYSAGSQDHPIYIRTYLEPRETYTPVPDLTPDPVFPTAVLVDEEVTRTEGEFDSRYVQVTRVYETLPGPQLLGKQMVTQFGGAVVDTKKQTVVAGALIAPDFRTLQAEISPEDTSKSVLQTVELPLNESWPVLTSIQNGPFNERIIVTSQVVPAETPLPANTGSIIYESEAVDRWRSIHTARNLSNLIGNGKQFIEYDMVSYSFPGLLIIRGRTLINKRNIVYQRSGLSGLYRTKIVTQFFSELPASDDSNETINFSPVSFSCDAGSFSNVLHNCQSIVVEGASIPAPQSIPTSLDYEMDGEFLIRSSIVKEQIGIYRSVKTYIQLK